MCWMSAIFLLPVCLTYWPRKYTTRVDPRVDNSHQVWSWYDHPLPSDSVFVCWYVTWLCNLDLRPWTVVVYGGSRGQQCHQVEGPMPIRSWFMSYNVSRWLPLTMRTRPLRMRRITWPVRRRQKQYNFYWATTTIKGRLLTSVTNAKALDCVNLLCVALWPWPLTV